MPTPFDISSMPGPAQKLLNPAAPAPAKMMAARGVMPGLKPVDIVTVVAALAELGEAEVATTARATLAKLPAPILNGALGGDLGAAVLERLAEHYASDAEVVERMLRQRALNGEALCTLATRADERIGELIATNEQRMLEFPKVIEKLYMNKRVRMSTADRLLELAVRNGLELDIPAFKEAAQAIQTQLIAEPSEEPTFEDVLFKETEELAQKVALSEDEDTHDVDDEGEETLREKFLPLHAKIGLMSISEKIRRATLGSSAERLMLVRDPNKLVSSAAARSPMLRENEAAQISANRNVSEEVLRIIALNREFTRSYQVKLNLVSNPRCPFTFAARMIPHLRESDLRTLGKSKNVPGNISAAVRQQLARKQGKTVGRS